MSGSSRRSDDATAGPGEDRADRPLRERVAETPRPALVWLAGALLLTALAAGDVAAAVLFLGQAVPKILGGIASIPGAAGDAVAANLSGDAPGAVAAAVGLLVRLLLAAALLLVTGALAKWLVVPWSLSDAVGFRGSSATEDVVEWVLVGAAIGAVAVVVTLTPVGDLFAAAFGWLGARLAALTGLPSVVSRTAIPNQGYWTPSGGWQETFLGLSPAQAWTLRVLVIYGYATAWALWWWKAYVWFREHYRQANWTPRDDMVDRLRGHYWGLFGVVVVFMFLVMAVFAAPLSPVQADHNVYSPYEHEISYWNGEEVETTTHGAANQDSRSQGGDGTVGLWEYDDYGRWAPLGTNQDGKDLFTLLAFGARVSLVIGLVATTIGAGIGTVLALVTAYYKGLVDLFSVVISDAVMSLPRLLLVLLLSVLFQEADHPVATLYDGGLLLALLFGATAWPFMWRAVRGPSFQVADQEWVDAARSYGQSPAGTMRRHMSPYIAGYMLIYASLSLGGVIIGVAALSFLGYGVNAPTPEWGRIVLEGKPYTTTNAWHIAFFPGFFVVLVVTAFNALGDGIRDAIDPQSEGSDGAGATATGGGG